MTEQYRNAGELLFAIQNRVPVGDVSLAFSRNEPVAVITYRAAINGIYHEMSNDVLLKFLSQPSIEAFADELSRRFNHAYEQATKQPERLPTITVGLSEEHHE